MWLCHSVCLIDSSPEHVSTEKWVISIHYYLRYLYYLLRLARNNSPWLHSPANWTVQLSRPIGAITSYRFKRTQVHSRPLTLPRNKRCEFDNLHRAKMYETCTRAPQQACIAALIHVNKMLTRRRAFDHKFLHKTL